MATKIPLAQYPAQVAQLAPGDTLVDPDGLPYATQGWVDKINSNLGICVDPNDPLRTLRVIAKSFLMKGASEYVQTGPLDISVCIETAGLGGLDTGIEEASHWYHVWAIAQDADHVSAILSLSDTDPALPTGYTFKKLVGSVRNDGDANFVPFVQVGHDAFYREGQFVGQYNATSATPFDITAFVPRSAVFANLSVLVHGAAPGSTIAAFSWVSDPSFPAEFAQVTSPPGTTCEVSKTFSLPVSLVVPPWTDDLYTWIINPAGGSGGWVDVYVTGWRTAYL